MRRHDLASATRLAGELARELGRDHYATGMLVANPRDIDGEADPVVYAWCDEPALARQLLAARRAGVKREALRVAHPDGTTAPVHEPGALEWRLITPRGMTDEEAGAPGP